MADSRLSDLLRDAATRLEADGLSHGTYFEGHNWLLGSTYDVIQQYRAENERIACDLFGAVYLEAKDDAEVMNAFSALALHGFGFESYNLPAAAHMVVWADDPALKVEDVTALLRRTADALTAGASK